MIKIGVDLSTTNTGIVVLDNHNNLIYTKDLTFHKFSEINLIANNNLIVDFVQELWSLIPNGEVINVGIELSNFENPMLTTRFNLYAGLIISNIISTFKEKISFKWFPSNSWQFKIGCVNQDKREVRKLKSKQFTKAHCKEYQPNWSEDKCDAYCIAYLLSEIKSQEMISNEAKVAKEKKKQEICLRLKKQKMINNRLQKIQKLDKIKNKKQIDKLQQEIKELSNGNKIK